MALVRKPLYAVNLTFEDRDKNRSTATFHIPTVASFDEALEAITDFFVPRVSALSDAVLVAWSMTTSAEDDAAGAAPEISDVERKGYFAFDAAGGSRYSVSIPSIKNTLVVDFTNTINRSDATVLSFLDLMTSAGVFAQTRPTTYLGADITRVEKAEKRHRGSTNG